MSDANIACPYCGTEMVFKVVSREDRKLCIEFKMHYKCPTCGSASPLICHAVSFGEWAVDREFSESAMKYRATKIIRDALASRAASNEWGREHAEEQPG